MSPLICTHGPAQGGCAQNRDRLRSTFHPVATGGLVLLDGHLDNALQLRKFSPRILQPDHAPCSTP
jgi:hypothetical protein